MPATGRRPDPHHALPIASLMLGACMWGVIWYPMRLLEHGGLQGLWLTLILYGAALVASLPYVGPRLGELARHPAAMVLLMLAAGWTNVAFVEAVLDGNILRVLLLFYLAPLWQTLMGWAILHERPSRIALASLGIAMLGALAMLWDPELGLPWPHSRADWMALSAGFAFAVSNVLIRQAHQVSIRAKSAAVWLGVVVVAGVLILALRMPVPAVSHETFLGSVALGLGGILVMTVLVQYGVTHMPTHRSAVIALVELIAGAISQQLLTDEVVSAGEWAGGILIVTGAYLAARASSPARRTATAHD